MIKTDQAHLAIAAATHPGMTGKQNEDRYRVTALLSSGDDPVPSILAVLCDGVGGHRAGEVAAEMGVSIITDQVAAGDESQPLRTLEKAITLASAAVYEASQADRGRAGMGATCACAWVIGDRLHTVNLGDSRIYLLREGHIVQLTTDHTWIQEALDAGIINDEEGGGHPNAHVIRRYLGSQGPPEPDFRLWFFEGEDDEAARQNQGLPLQPGDIVLLTSDGLTDLVSDEDIRTVLEKNDLAAAPGLLIEMANTRGGHDNTTIVLLQVPSSAKGRLSKKKRWLIGCLVVLALASIMLTAALLGVRWWAGRSRPTDTPIPAETRPIEATPGAPTTTLTTAPALSPTLSEDAGEPGPTITPWPTDTLSP